MALTFIGETEFVQSGPPQWQQSLWDLDTLTIPFSGSQPNLNSFLNSLEKGSPADIDGDMHLMDWRISGTKAYPQVDLVFTGKKNGELPPGKRTQNTSIQSASSNRSNAAILAQPATIQFYAPTSTLSYISKDAPGIVLADDPAGIPELISYTFFDTTFSISSGIEAIVNTFFIPQVIATMQSEELVPDIYWRNTSQKTKTYMPFVFDLPSGGFAYLYTLGSGYQVGDTVTVSAGGESASITIDSVWSDGGILDFHQTSNTFSTAYVGLAASGGSGHGAAFNIIVIP